jgi:alkyl hydroperoxide reductase subunit AhpC
MQSGTAEEVKAYMARQKIKFPVVLDPDGTFARRYGAVAVPASFIIDGKGKVRFVEFGYTTEIGLRLRLWLAALLYS